MNIEDAYTVATDEMNKADNQRFTFFNFFIILAGLLVNAIVLCIREDIWIIAIIVATFLIVISILFMLLERRNSYNYKRLNDLLVLYEQKMKEKSMSDEENFEYVHSFRRKIFAENNMKHKISQTRIFKLVYFLFSFLGLLSLILSIVLWAMA